MTQRIKKSIPSFMLIALAFSYGAASSAYAQYGAPTASLPEHISVPTAGDLGLDQFSAPSVDVTVSAGGTVGENALITARTENIDGNTAVFSWFVDDEPAPRLTGRAKTSLSIITQKPSHVVRVVVSVDGKKVAENTASVNSFTAVLAWRADSFVPADYEGKALASVGSRVTVTALPEIRGEKSEDLLYTWYLDAESQVRNVVGEEEFSFFISKNVRSVSVIVEVSNQSQSLSVKQAINVPVVRPSAALAPAGASLTIAPGAKTTVRAVPLYFHIASLNELSFVWSFGGHTVAGVPPDPHVLSLAVPLESGRGTRMLFLDIENKSAPEETARAEMEVNIL